MRKGLYWRRHGALRYFTRSRYARFGLGRTITTIERLRSAKLIAGRYS